MNQNKLRTALTLMLTALFGLLLMSGCAKTEAETDKKVLKIGKAVRNVF